MASIRGALHGFLYRCLWEAACCSKNAAAQQRQTDTVHVCKVNLLLNFLLSVLHPIILQIVLQLVLFYFPLLL